jgi:hypothetical protein
MSCVIVMCVSGMPGAGWPVARRKPIAKARHHAFELGQFAVAVMPHRHGASRRRHRNVFDPSQPPHGRVDFGGTCRAIHAFNPKPGLRRCVSHHEQPS